MPHQFIKENNGNHFPRNLSIVVLSKFLFCVCMHENELHE